MIHSHSLDNEKGDKYIRHERFVVSVPARKSDGKRFYTTIGRYDTFKEAKIARDDYFKKYGRDGKVV